MRFGKALRKVMDERGITGVALSKKSGVPTPYISQLFSGAVKDPSFVKACALIDALDMTLQEFRDLQSSDEEVS